MNQRMIHSNPRAPGAALCVSASGFALAIVLGLTAVDGLAATITTVDEGPVAGQPSVAIGADGLPVIAYRTLGNKLRVAKCRNWDCTDVARIDLSGGYFTTAHFSLDITPNGYPGIAFQDSVERRLDVVRCVTDDCTGGGHVIFTIDPGPNDVGAYVDWAFGPDNRAAFAYRDFTAGTLQLARCTTPACANVDIETLHGGGGVRTGEFAAIAFGDRADPVVSTHWTNDTGASPIAGVNAFDCSVVPCEDSLETIHYQVDPVGIGQDMAIAPDDHPVFSYIDYTNGTLLFARCAETTCGGIVELSLVDDGSFAIGFDDSTSIGVRPDGRPVIAYQKELAIIGGRTALYVAECSNERCSSASVVTIERSAEGLTTGVDADLVIDEDGAAVIAYFDQSALDIKLARCSPETCRGPGDHLFSDGFDGTP